MNRLPIALEKEPLVEAVFEARFSGNPQLADILPGALLSSLNERPTIKRLPAHEIPDLVRSSDKNLVFTPVVRLELQRFNISIGDRNVVIGCNLPYPKWSLFKNEILTILDAIVKIGLSPSLERYSLKYVNIIESPQQADQLSRLNASISICGFRVKNDHVALRVQRQEKETLHIISVITGAEASIPTKGTVSGVVVDIDSIVPVKDTDLRMFLEDAESALESLRQSNKEKFFSCLKEETIKAMEPRYD